MFRSGKCCGKKENVARSLTDMRDGSTLDRVDGWRWLQF